MAFGEGNGGGEGERDPVYRARSSLSGGDDMGFSSDESYPS